MLEAAVHGRGMVQIRQMEDQFPGMHGQAVCYRMNEKSWIQEMYQVFMYVAQGHSITDITSGIEAHELLN